MGSALGPQQRLEQVSDACGDLEGFRGFLACFHEPMAWIAHLDCIGGQIRQFIDLDGEGVAIRNGSEDLSEIVGSRNVQSR